MKKQRLAISFSGGETSAYLTQRLISEWSDDYEMHVFFANTGEEQEESLIFVDKCSKYFGFHVTWIEAVIDPINGKGTQHKVVDFKTASRNGEPFEAMIQKYGIPDIQHPYCTRELKSQALSSAQRDLGCYQIAIGIRYDEWDRIGTDPKIIYPLIDWKIQKADINRFWAEMPFRLNLKGYEGNCKTCWKKSDRKLATIAVEHPEWFDNFRRWEQLYENFRPETQPTRPLPARFFRQYKTVSDIFAIAQKPGFVKTSDDKLNTVAYEQYELDLQVYGCSESCEAF